MTATEQREIAAMERRRVASIAAGRGVSAALAVAVRRERLRTLRTLLLLRHEAKTLRAARGEEPEPNRAWYVRQVSRVTWAIDGASR
jgi:hypothetical protein